MWIVLKDIILSEISQTEKEKYCTISLNVEYENKTRQKLHQVCRYSKQIGGCQRWGLGGRRNW